MGATLSLCGYDETMESPAAYVVAYRKIEFERMMQMIAEEKEKQTVVDKDNMTMEELREYYAKSGKDRWENMTEAEKRAMQKKIDVSLFCRVFVKQI